MKIIDIKFTGGRKKSCYLLVENQDNILKFVYTQKRKLLDLKVTKRWIDFCGLFAENQKDRLNIFYKQK